MRVQLWRAFPTRRDGGQGVRDIKLREVALLLTSCVGPLHTRKGEYHAVGYTAGAQSKARRSLEGNVAHELRRKKKQKHTRNFFSTKPGTLTDGLKVCLSGVGR